MTEIGRTEAWVGDVLRNGARCENCATTYAACTEHLLRRKPFQACCASCRYADTHDVKDGALPRSLPPVVTYDVWYVTGDKLPRRSTAHLGYSNLSVAQSYVDEYNREEAANAKMEGRRVETRWFVVKATSTFEEV